MTAAPWPLLRELGARLDTLRLRSGEAPELGRCSAHALLDALTAGRWALETAPPDEPTRAALAFLGAAERAARDLWRDARDLADVLRECAEAGAEIRGPGLEPERRDVTP